MAGDAPERAVRLRVGLALLAILAIAAALRFYGMVWDGGMLFHPDERHILVVANGIAFPPLREWHTLLRPESPWNPQFFAYGSLPIYLLRIMADLAGQFEPSLATLQSSYLVGRTLSALFDLGSVALVFRLGYRLYSARVGLLAAALTAVTVLHVQLAHFFAVDTMLAFLVLLTVDLAISLTDEPTMWRGVGVGGAWGAALATKVSAAPLGLAVAVAWVLGAVRRAARSQGARAGRQDRSFALGTATVDTPSEHSADPCPPKTARRRLWTFTLRGMVVTGVAALVTFVLCEPYAVIDAVTFVTDVAQESQMARGTYDIPYTRQFIGTLPYVYPIQQAIVWSMGVPLGVTGFIALAVATVRGALAVAARSWRQAGDLLVPLAWVLPYLAIVGGFHAKFLRYLLPILPFLALWAAWMLVGLLDAGRQRFARALGWGALIIVVGGSSLYALGYLNVYSETHPWIQTTAWLCTNLPAGSHISVEHWDDTLPLVQATGELRCAWQHRLSKLAVYDRDDEAKLEMLLSALEGNDYIVLASNRLYNTIPRLPERYPLTSRYYQLLLGEELGFELVYSAATYPRVLGVDLVHDTFREPDLPKPALLRRAESQRRALVLGRADESYSVYDHPLTMVFRKVEALSRDELLQRFGDAAQSLPPVP
jgi:hypothetical protein